MMHFLTRTFLKGLAVVFPVAAAAYLIYWMTIGAERLIKSLLLQVLPEQFYVPGLGLVLVVAGIFGIGLLMYPWLTRIFLQGADRLLRRVPLVNMIYSPIRDLMEMFGGDVTQKLGQVVMVTVPGTGLETIGFVMQEETAHLPDGFAKDGHVVVYLQMSYQVGGYCFVVPRDNIRPVDMTVQQALRWVLMAGVSTPGQRKAKSIEKPPDSGGAP